ncbi:type IV pilus modification protein PilV [Pseudomonas nicosulfuronedens]|uniref:Type IV pilus modification protein PilV n=1 Tax=Pseudomonas nicosulfuronedens TaxID=2571105 RepID=A0A5R9RSM3_9PSED|nr:type IV pilus modification protein PilV [Pseudomonas nicosulfuronedens]MDH1007856.1 type IV pilus modification protein PilV [Pseudomonas nicosulfuronedens]MDH1978442.1 type IV pilus modification protein PilV [Pseudomonas nicosulfuronedens]MDH2024967.1 type IV pilus modification protein PilV [Pseudomonas nicosulfuronedens]TLX80790.1 type IV pilus modification protein PilV [Pseudomonas nicosulfuronedens]
MTRNAQHGITMIEVLVTLLVFTVGLLGVAALQLNALKGTADSNQRSQATWVMQELAERMRANSVGAESSYTTAPNCSTLPTTWCADHFNPISGAKVNAATCTSDQMAAFDRWEAQCSYAASTTYAANATAAAGRYTSTDFLTAPSQGAALTVNANNHLITLTSRWKSKGDEAKQQSSESVLSASLGVRR